MRGQLAVFGLLALVATIVGVGLIEHRDRQVSDEVANLQREIEMVTQGRDELRRERDELAGALLYLCREGWITPEDCDTAIGQYQLDVVGLLRGTWELRRALTEERALWEMRDNELAELRERIAQQVVQLARFQGAPINKPGHTFTLDP